MVNKLPNSNKGMLCLLNQSITHLHKGTESLTAPVEWIDVQ